MKLFSFCILTALALLYAGLTVAETITYRKWEQAVGEQKEIQLKVQFFQNQNRVINSLLRRMAYDSLHDPALAQFLKEKKIKVVVNDVANPGTVAPSGVNNPSSSVPLPDSTSPSNKTPAAPTP